MLGGRELEDKSFKVGIYDTSKCKVTGLDKAIEIFHPLSFQVDISKTGIMSTEDIPLDVNVTDGKGVIHSDINQREALYTIKCTPNSHGKLKIAINLGEKQVQNSPFSVNVKPRSAM